LTEIKENSPVESLSRRVYLNPTFSWQEYSGNAVNPGITKW